MLLSPAGRFQRRTAVIVVPVVTMMAICLGIMILFSEAPPFSIILESLSAHGTGAVNPSSILKLRVIKMFLSVSVTPYFFKRGQRWLCAADN